MFNGINGFVESLPLLFSLPLLRAVFLNESQISLLGQHISTWEYFYFILAFLLGRFLFSSYVFQWNAAWRLNFLKNYREKHAAELNDTGVQTKGAKWIQTMNFITISYTQLVPGVLFLLLGTVFMYKFALVVLLAAIPFAAVLLVLQRRNAKAQELAAKSLVEFNQSIHSKAKVTAEEINHSYQSRLAASKSDGRNKSFREIAIVGLLLTALIGYQTIEPNASLKSFYIMILFLRGLQHCYTGYIQYQNANANKSFILSH